MAMIIRSLADSVRFQNDIENLLQWCNIKKLKFNQTKCDVITFTRSSQSIKVSYKMEDHVIERKSEIRDLGILIDRKLTFASDIEQITAKARQALGYIKRISKGEFEAKTLKVLYTAYIRSKLEFGAVVWDPYLEIYCIDIESIQRQFVLYALGDNNRIAPYRLSSYEERCKKLGLDTLLMRRTELNPMIQLRP